MYCFPFYGVERCNRVKPSGVGQRRYGEQFQRAGRKTALRDHVCRKRLAALRIVDGNRVRGEIAAPLGGGQGLNARGAGRSANPKLLVSTECKQLVFAQRPAQRETGLVAFELILLAREEVAGIQRVLRTNQNASP